MGPTWIYSFGKMTGTVSYQEILSKSKLSSATLRKPSPPNVWRHKSSLCYETESSIVKEEQLKLSNIPCPL